jgi:hypothetical protein
VEISATLAGVRIIPAVLLSSLPKALIWGYPCRPKVGLESVAIGYNLISFDYVTGIPFL